MNKTTALLLIFLLFLLSAAACGTAAGTEDEKTGYRSITADEAKRIMEEEEGFVILDVRTRAEFAEGHIPGAVCVPNETITDAPPAELPDRTATVLVYCRSGRRSKEAAAKLAELGYTGVLEFGGIIDWTGEVVR